MRSLRTFLVAVLTAFTLLFLACTETKTTEAGLGIIITTNLTTPADLDSVELEVRQETAPGKYESVLFQNRVGVPLEAQLPASFTVGSGNARQNAYIRLTGRRGDQALVLREVKIQIPKTRVAALTLVLAASCLNHLKIDETGAAQTDCANTEESCQPETGQCGPTLLDVNTLPDFDPAVQLAEAGAIPLVKLDAGRVNAPDTGAGDTGVLDSGPPKSAAKEITKLAIQNVEGAIVGDLITVVLPPNADLATLAPAITITGTSISPPGDVPQNFTKPVKYLVTAEDGSSREYTVVVQITGTGSKKITAFELPQGSTVIDGTNITVTVPNGTSITLVAPDITFEGKTVSPPSGAAQNFTNPFPYKVTAYDGTTLIYTVKVIVAAASDKDITELSIEGTKGTITGTNITVTVPGSSNVASLRPKVVITGKSVSPASLATQSFTSPVKYTVTAADNTTKVYNVTVTALPKTSKDITAFSIQGVVASIIGTNISLTLPPATNVTGLVPSITHTGTSINPGNGVPQDFTSPRQYVVTAEDNSKQMYTVTVTSAPGSNEKDITDFVVNGVHAVFVNTNGNVQLTGPSNLIGLVPTITVSPFATVSPTSGSAQNFNAGPVLYTVTAQNGSQKQYSITVTQPTAAAPQFNPPSPSIQNAPFDVNITSATPTAVIHYTTDGSLPDVGSPTALPVNIATASVVLKAIAIAPGYQSQYSGTGLYGVKVASVVFFPVGGTYANEIDTLTLSTSTSGATICYTQDSTTPACTPAGGCSPNATTYSGPLSHLDSPGPAVFRPFNAIGCKAGLADSIGTSSSYVWVVATPVYSPPSGHYPDGTVVNISTLTQPKGNYNVGMYATNDGTDPICGGPDGQGSHGTFIASNTVSFTLSAKQGPFHFKFVGCRADYAPSLVSAADFFVP